MPEPGKAAADGYYPFQVVREEIKRNKKGTVQGSKESVLGTCLYDVATRDYKCPKLPPDASI